MLGIAGDLHGDAAAVLLAHGDQHRAGIRQSCGQAARTTVSAGRIAHGHAPAIGRSIMRAKKASQAATCS